MAHRYTPRLATFDYRGTHSYFLTFSTHSRQRYFVSSDVVGQVARCLARAADTERFEVSVYCFMPDHAHLLVRGLTAMSDAHRFIAHFKQLSGYYFAATRHERLWQRSGWDRILRTSVNPWTFARYILANPIRAGLAETLFEYPYSGSFVYGQEQLREVLKQRQP